jgi:plasmid stabilization system protein ParE
VPLKIRYSLRARDEEIELLEYIIQKFGHGKAKEVFEKIEKTQSLICQNPEMYKVSNRRKDL